MTRELQQAFEAASRLPDAQQDRIGRELKAYLVKLERLRADIDEGIRSLDAGEGRELNIEELLGRVLALPPDRQADVARIVGLMKTQDDNNLGLSEEQAAEVRRRLDSPAAENIPMEEVFSRLRSTRA
jgi:hypothetical protein